MGTGQRQEEEEGEGGAVSRKVKQQQAQMVRSFGGRGLHMKHKNNLNPV